MSMKIELRPFKPEWAREVLQWVTDPDDCRRWSNRRELAGGPAIFADWHADPETRPFLLFEGEAAIAYGEIWIDPEAGEVELARLIVAPRRRKCGTGRRFVALLVNEAAGTGLPYAFVRVHPDNVAAIACYGAAGFSRVAPEVERLYNRNQPVEYFWFRKHLVA